MGIQNKFIPANSVLSTNTNRLYKCILTAGSTYVNDIFSNVVYLITYNKFELQYVGETSQNLNRRLNWHNFYFRNTTANFFCKILITHFRKGYCKDSSYIVNIIEKLKLTRHRARNTIDCAAKPIQLMYA